jgi:predicted nucleotide-binding protein
MEDTNSSSEPTPVVTILRRLLARGDQLAKIGNLSQGNVAMWTSGIRSQLMKLYGKNSLALEHFPRILPKPPLLDTHGELEKRIAHVRRMVDLLDSIPKATKTQLQGKRIFIGHGRSPLWRELKDFIADRLGLPWDEFNREPVAGVTTSDRIERMMSDAAFALLIMTAEEEHADSKVYARPNVIHEVGLFQGKLGIRRAIILLEESCSEFSNIYGLSQIRFPPGDIAARFEEIRRVLEREGLLS